MLNLQFILLYLWYVWREGFAENVRIPSYRERGYKIVKKTIIYLNVPLAMHSRRRLNVSGDARF